MKLRDAQKAVLRGMAPAAALAVAGLLGAPFLIGEALGAGPVLAARLSLAPLAGLALGIGALARHRFFSAKDIDGSGLTAGTARARVLDAILRNTLEQSVLALGAYWAWAILAPPAWGGSAVAAAALFVVGRILFARGYAEGAGARAFGFALTFYPSALLIAALFVLTILGG